MVQLEQIRSSALSRCGWSSADVGLNAGTRIAVDSRRMEVNLVIRVHWERIKAVCTLILLGQGERGAIAAFQRGGFGVSLQVDVHLAHSTRAIWDEAEGSRYSVAARCTRVARLIDHTDLRWSCAVDSDRLLLICTGITGILCGGAFPELLGTSRARTTCFHRR
jgi:hypothetical protein